MWCFKELLTCHQIKRHILSIKFRNLLWVKRTLSFLASKSRMYYVLQSVYMVSFPMITPEIYICHKHRKAKGVVIKVVKGIRINYIRFLGTKNNNNKTQIQKSRSQTKKWPKIMVKLCVWKSIWKIQNIKLSMQKSHKMQKYVYKGPNSKIRILV